MKNICFIILLFLTNRVLYSQISISEEVKEIYNIADHLIQNNITEKNIKINFSKNEAFVLARKLSNAIKNDPVGYNVHMIEKYKKWEKETEQNGFKPISIKPAYKIYMLKKVISEFFGEEFTGIITTPIFLRVKIIDITSETYTSKTAGIQTRQTNLFGQIENIVKGPEIFEAGDTIKISFLNWWINSCNIEFEKDKSYFLPIKLSNCTQNLGCETYSLRIFDSECLGINKIENEYLLNPQGILLNSKSISWNQFEDEFINTYVNF